MGKMYAELVKVEFDQLKRYHSEREALKDKGFRLVGRIEGYSIAGKQQPGRQIYQDNEGTNFALYSTNINGYKVVSAWFRKFVGDPAKIIKM
jgi:hypothetical protein